MNPIERGVRNLDKFQQRHGPAAFVFAVIKKFGDDQGGNLAALLTYYAFLSVFPLLLVLITVLGIALRNNPSLQHRVLNSALVEFPIIGTQLKNNIHSLNRTGIGLAVGLIGSFLGARGVASAMQNAMNAIWQVPYARRPGFPWNQLRSIGVLLALGAGLIITGALSGLGGGTGTLGAGIRIGVLVLSLLLNIGLFTLAFRLATAKEVRTRQLVPGAVLTAISWQVLQALAGYVISHALRHATAVYGTFGFVLGLLSWLYLQAQVTLYAVEADVVREKHLWPRSITQPPLTEGDKRSMEGYAEKEQRRPEQDVNVEFDSQASADPQASAHAEKDAAGH